MSQSTRRFALVSVLLALPFTSAAIAEGSPPTAEQIAKWTAQLEADDYAVREKATEELTEAGKAAIPVLEKALTAGGPETGVRVLSILGKHYKSDDEGTRTAATEALTRIAGDGTQLGASAKSILTPEGKKTPGAQAGVVTSVHIGGVGGVVQVGGGVVQINGGNVIQFGGGGGAVTLTVQAAAGPQGTSVKVSSVNGVKDISVTEGGKTTKILEQANGAIEVVVTEQVDGKPKTTKFQAKNAEELKKKHPKLHGLYVKHSKTAKP